MAWQAANMTTYLCLVHLLLDTHLISLGNTVRPETGKRVGRTCIPMDELLGRLPLPAAGRLALVVTSPHLAPCVERAFMPED